MAVLFALTVSLLALLSPHVTCGAAVQEVTGTFQVDPNLPTCEVGIDIEFKRWMNSCQKIYFYQYEMLDTTHCSGSQCAAASSTGPFFADAAYKCVQGRQLTVQGFQCGSSQTPSTEFPNVARFRINQPFPCKPGTCSLPKSIWDSQ